MNHHSPNNPSTFALRPGHRRALGVAAAMACLGASATASAGGTACHIKGHSVVPHGIKIFTDATGNTELAQFMGKALQMDVEVPGLGKKFAKIRAISGKGKFEVKGYAPIGEFLVFTKKNLPVVPNHVWLGGGRVTHVAGAPAGKIKVVMKVPNPVSQTLTTTTKCGNIVFGKPGFKAKEMPGNARGYVARKAPLQVQAKPGRKKDVIFTFTQESIKDALLFWSDEPFKRGYIHVTLQGDLLVNGWVPWVAVKRLPKGEMMDALDYRRRLPSPTSLSIQGAPRKIKVTKATKLHSLRKADSPVIGEVRPGMEVLVMETVLDWSKILPPSLAMTPQGNHGFWVKTKDLTAKP